MAKTKVLRGQIILKENSLTESLSNRILSYDSTTGEITSRPAIAVGGSFISTVLPSAQILVGNGSNVATAVAMSGVIAITNGGVTSIVDGSIVNADINASAAIAYSKLSLTGSIVNADVSASAAIVYSKLTLTGAIVNADIAVAAAIARTKIASGTAYRILANNSLGVMSENAAITASRAVVSDVNGQLIHQTDGTTAVQIGYSSTLTGNIQTQLDNEIATRSVNAIVKAPTSGEDGYAIIWDDGAQEYTLGDPVTQGIPVAGSTRQFLGKNSGTNYDADWLDIITTDITDITATAAELNILDGATLDVTELNYVDGVTSAIQTQLDDKQSSSLAQNSIWVGNGSNVAAQLSSGTSGYVLTSVSGVPQWQPPTSISDGDKGDIVVSGSGATWTVDTNIAKAWTGAHSFLDSNFSILDNADTSKIAKFEASGISAVTTRTYTLPDASGTLALTTDLSAYWSLASGGTLTGPNIITQPVSTSGSPTMLTFVGAAHTTLAASVEATDINFNLSRTVQFSTGDITTQRAFRIQAPTYGFVGASTITNAATVTISGAPVAGTNAVITRPCGLLIGTTTVPGTTIGTMLAVKGTSGHSVAIFEAAASATGFAISPSGNIESYGSASRSITSGLTGGFLLSNTYSIKFDGSLGVEYSVVGGSGGYTDGHVFNHTASVTDSTNPVTTIKLTSTFAPTTGTNGYTNIRISPVYDFSGGTREVIGLNYNPTLTGMTGVTHYAIVTGSGLQGFGTLTPTHQVHVKGTSANQNLFLVEENGGANIFEIIEDAGVNKIGFFASSPVEKATALTAKLTQITNSAPGTPDYAIQDLVAAVGYGFVTADEAQTVLSVIKNLQVRLDELEAKQQAYGLLS